jgi:hypothetical protein
MDIDLVDLVIGLPVEADADLSTFEFSITDNRIAKSPLFRPEYDPKTAIVKFLKVHL